MTHGTPDAEIASLLVRLEEAEETIRAIRGGGVDAFVVEGSAGPKVYTLETADRPYRLLVEEMQQGAVTLGDEGEIAYCNRRFAELVGRPLERLIGVPLRDFIPQDARADYESLLQRGGAGNSQGESHVRHTGGALIPVFITFNALPPDSGVAVGVLFTDLTTQHHQEQMDVVLEALREADRRKDEFLAMLSHELRGPLAPIVSALQTLGLQRENENSLQKQARGIIERQMGRFVPLLDGLLEVSRVTSGRVDVRRKRVAVSEIVDGALESARPLIEQRRHELVVSLPAEPIWLHADAARLEQVLVNLLSNAAKYTEEGGRVWLTIELDAPHVVIRVRDTGVGIDPALLPRAFDLFTQAQRPVDRSQGGLGIGLALVRQLTEMHEGTVEVKSELGHGSEFVLRLPVLPIEAPASSATPELDEPTPRHLRVLVVDDDVETVAALTMLLQAWGHEVRSAGDGTAGVQAALEFEPDVALLDIGLPGLNGHQVAKRIRLAPALENVVLIAVTGYGQESDRRTAVAAGFDHHVAKPARLDQLQQILATVQPRPRAQ